VNRRIFIEHALEVQYLEAECAAHYNAKVKVLIPEGVVPSQVKFGQTVAQQLLVINRGFCNPDGVCRNGIADGRGFDQPLSPCFLTVSISTDLYP